jgi:ubiquinone/menaquinone biosynthesis C-methylase UbiE
MDSPTDSHAHRHFVPAAGHDRLLFLYDPLNRLLGAARHRAWLVESAGVRAGERVLDLGCGTGELALALKARAPGARISALDPDPKALARARAKAASAGLEIAFEQGFGDALPYPDASFAHVVSSLVLHHLEPAQKDAALREVARVLAPGGALHVLDFGPPSGAFTRALTHLLHRGEAVGDQLAGSLPGRMRAAGLVEVAERGRRATPLGSLSLYAARRAEAGQGSAGSGAPV